MMNYNPNQNQNDNRNETEYSAYRVVNGAGNAQDQYQAQSATAKKKAKSNRFSLLTVLVACVLSLAGGAAMMFGLLSPRNSSEKQTDEDSFLLGETEKEKEEDKEEEADETGSSASETKEESEKQNSVTVPTFEISNDSGAELTAKQIYANYVNSVVGIVSEGTTSNIFGQVTQTASSGTGFILSADGYIMTNYHVIESGKKLTVTLYNGTSYEATIVGAEEENDVAVLKIDASNLVPVVLGNSEEISVGDDVAIIGNPLGELTFTMTRGIVSALNREIDTGDGPIRMFQIDAAVNSGNSGGPAFNSQGKVIGIVTAKYSSSSVEGIGFCIPISDAVEIAEDLVTYGYLRGKPTIGVTLTDASEIYSYYSRYYGRWNRNSALQNLSQTGAYVSAVASDSTAYEAGIREGDTILSVDGVDIADADAFETALKQYKPGDKIKLTVLQNGIETTFTVTVAEKVPTGIQSEAEYKGVSF